VTKRAEELIRYGPAGAPQALAEAREIAESIGGAAPSEREAGNRAIALLMVWCGLAAANPAHAARYVAAAKSVAPQVTGSGPAWAIRLSRALAVTDADEAVRFAESLRDDIVRSRAMATVAGLIAADHPERAAGLARGIADPRQRVAALASVAAAVAAKDARLSRRLTAEAESVTRAEVPDDDRPGALCEVIEAVAATDPVRAGQLAEQLPAAAVGEVRRAGLTLAVAWARTDPDRAERLARSQELKAHAAVALAQVAAAVQPADPARAAVLADEADRLAAAACDRWGPGSILAALTYQRLASAFAAVDPGRALRYAHAVTTTPETALTKIDTLVDIGTAVPPPGLRRSPEVPRQRRALAPLIQNGGGVPAAGTTPPF
jgi:hypothetical protein